MTSETDEETRAAARQRIRQEARQNADTPAPDLPDTLPPDGVEIEEKVFQQRALSVSTFGASLSHVEGLAEAIRRDPTRGLEPIDVWWTGRRWVVIDGHHRLKAYRKVHSDEKRPLSAARVPVRAFAGSFHDAFARSVHGNAQDKLPMSETEKSDAAWRLTCEGYEAAPPWSKSEVARWSGRSESQISKTRRVRKSLLQKIAAGEIEDVAAGDLMNLSWDDAQSLDRGENPRSWDEEQLDKQAMIGADKMRRTFKNTFAKSPDMAARILLAYSPGLPKALMQSEAWWEIRAEMEEEEQGEDPEDDLSDF